MNHPFFLAQSFFESCHRWAFQKVFLLCPPVKLSEAPENIFLEPSDSIMQQVHDFHKGKTKIYGFRAPFWKHCLLVCCCDEHIFGKTFKIIYLE